jgi:hypothetical protein
MWGPGKMRKVMATDSCRLNKERRRIGRSGGATSLCGHLARGRLYFSVLGATRGVISTASSILDSTLDVIGAIFSILDSTLDVIGATSSIIDSTLNVISALPTSSILPSTSSVPLSASSIPPSTSLESFPS